MNIGHAPPLVRRADQDEAMTEVAAVGVAEWAIPPTPVPVRRRRRLAGSRPRTVTVLAGILILAGAATYSAASVDSDTGRDLATLISAVGLDTTRLRWQFAVIVIGLAGLHYLATAIAARAAAGIPLALGETVLVQLSAAAANRLTPGGLGGSAVNARFFTRRGLDPRASVGAVSMLSVLGAIADLIVLAVLVFLGRLLGLGSGASEVALLWSKVTGLVAPLLSPLTWIVIALAATVLLLGSAAFRRPDRKVEWRRFLTPILSIARRPGALVVLLLASGATTLILGLAFIASTAMVPGPQPHAAVGALLVAFMAASAAGTAVPVPAGLGSTEAALVAVLVATGVPAPHAVEVVLIYRLITFWLPAAAGVIATRHLRQRAAI